MNFKTYVGSTELSRDQLLVRLSMTLLHISGQASAIATVSILNALEISKKELHQEDELQAILSEISRNGSSWEHVEKLIIIYVDDIVHAREIEHNMMTVTE